MPTLTALRTPTVQSGVGYVPSNDVQAIAHCSTSHSALTDSCEDAHPHARGAVRLRLIFFCFVVSIIAMQSAPRLLAEPLLLSLEHESLDAPPGATVTFTGRITNFTGVDLNATDLFFSFAGFDPLEITPTQVLGSVDVIFRNGIESEVIALFDVLLGVSAITGVPYLIDVLIVDINNHVSNTVIASVVAIAEIREPTSLTLVVIAVTWIAWAMRGRNGLWSSTRPAHVASGSRHSQRH